MGLIEILDRHPEELETLRNLRRLSSRESAGNRLTSTGKKGVRSAAAAA